MSTDEYLDSITDHSCPRCHEQGKLLVNFEETEPDRDKDGNLRYKCLNPRCCVVFSVDDNDNITCITPPLQMDISFMMDEQIIKRSIRWEEEQGVIITEQHFNEFPGRPNVTEEDLISGTHAIFLRIHRPDPES